MDRRYLHKTNGQTTRNNKENVSRARAKNRATHQDAQRELEPAAEVVELPHLERLKLWCLERDKKKQMAQQLKKRSSVSAVGRGVCGSDKTNYLELNKQRRRKTVPRQMNAQQNLPVPGRKVVPSSSCNISDRQSLTEVVASNIDDATGESPAHTEMSSVFNVTFEKDNSIATSGIKSVHEDRTRSTDDARSIPALNVTFEKENSFNKNQTFEADDQSPLTIGTVKADFSSDTTTPKLSFNVAFESLPKNDDTDSKPNKRRKTWSKSGQLDTFRDLELNRSVQASPPVPQNQEASKYFRFRVDNECRNLNDVVKYWTEYKDQHDHIDGTLLDAIDDAIGQSKLLIDQKFKQFLDSCVKCQSETSQPLVRPSDLENFWSTLFEDVEECNRKFQKLTALAPASDDTDQTKMEKNKKASARSRKTDVTSSMRTLRQTPVRLASTTARRNILSAETPSKSESSQSPSAPKSTVAERRTSTDNLSEEPHSTTEPESLSSTPNNRKITTLKATASLRRSHRRLCSGAEK
ncbi:uncharacterized protein LOC119084265 isoform X2 [Bradysia coprophila]|uniref:uncharacterized protein LOC119084265 isoform X2 n=1 Tax=Bradysia coprophila TaxID=38358 RepID=UPI00187D8E95|nr:uncharacterized protein LOC119084265 isoform X2 [Bradysia coprophila]XP_037050077.1 uncharacterized protein LOC119084265 isoform X2 [Bradysia coprophila]